MYHSKSLPQIFDAYFLPIEQAHNYNTRSRYLNSIRTDSGKNSIKFYGAQLWNEIPVSIKSLSFPKFKREYRKILLNG